MVFQQAIAYNELQKPLHKTKIDEAISMSKKLAQKYPEVPAQELAVEIVVCLKSKSEEEHRLLIRSVDGQLAVGDLSSRHGLCSCTNQSVLFV